jgi:carbon-monoxide dehydrogenase large subunit
VPCTTNPLGIKGIGEGGAIGAPPAVVEAVLDALRPLGVQHIDMPATPQRVWEAIRLASLVSADTCSTTAPGQPMATTAEAKRS